MKKKLAVALIFGGRSQEHAASVASARDMYKVLRGDTSLELVPVFISKTGEWFDGASAIKGKTTSATTFRVQVSLDNSKLLNFLSKKGVAKTVKLDAAIPWVLGPYGEDGTLPGLLEMANIPYVGSSVFAAACGFNKLTTKRYLASVGIPQAQYLAFTKDEWQSGQAAITKKITKTLTLPLFVKPACSGSSIGVSKVKKENDLKKAVVEALKFDTTIIVEQAVATPTEAECAVIGNGTNVQVSVPGAAQFEGEFYDYHAKYEALNWSVSIPPRLPKKIIAEVQRLAKEVFIKLGASGLARVDFLVEGKTNKVFFNEINTYPTFRSESMVTHLLGSIGISYKEAIKKLITLAIKRHAEAGKRQLSFGGKVSSIHL